MHKEILNQNQIQLLPLIQNFKAKYYLVGGTAIALYLGHRESIDFDLFTHEIINHDEIKRIIRNNLQIQSVLVENSNELTLVVNQVKMTFLSYPFNIKHPSIFDNYIMLPSLDTLIAMKSYALGRRAKWKDYVDIYFYLRNNSFATLVKTTQQIFDKEFNEKLFREQLAYFDDIDYTESVMYLKLDHPTDNQIKDYLQKVALET